jgi:charged multivesicular body protein 4A/B
MGTVDDSETEWMTSWKAAHSRTCRSRNSLFATANQVMEYCKAQSNDESLIAWCLPDKNATVAWNAPDRVQVICKPTEETVTTPTKAQNPTGTTETPPTAKKGLFSYVTETLFSPLSSILTPSKPQYDMGVEEDDALRDWDSTYEEQDDAKVDYECDSETYENPNFIGWEVPILEIELAQECLQILESALRSQEPSGFIFPKIVPKRSANTTEQRWMDWIQSIHPENSFLTSLSDAEMNFLLECLAHKGLIYIISRKGKHDLIVLGPEENNINNKQTYHDVLASWYEMSAAIHSLEARREQWSKQAEYWTQRARQEKQKQQTKRALASLKLRKLFEQRLEQTEGTILNLEMGLHALESSWDQREVVQALANSAKTMQTMRQQLEEADEIVEDYREEMDQLTDVQQAISDNDTDFDDGDLLKELEGLSLQGNVEKGISTEPEPVKAVCETTDDESTKTKDPQTAEPASQKEEPASQKEEPASQKEEPASQKEEPKGPERTLVAE